MTGIFEENRFKIAQPAFFTRLILSIGAALGASAPAFAHSGHSEASDFISGFAHPLGGIDHILAMVAVGILATLIGGPARWGLPLSFLAFMAIGGAVEANGLPTMVIEAAILASVAILLSLILFSVRLPVWTAVAGVALFALFHGFAHLVELPSGADRYEFGAGFLTATALLHIVGIVLGMAAQRWRLVPPNTASAG